MEIINAVILGLVQGITEFLPISSSGHLIILRDILGQQVDYGLAYDAVLQLATTLAILLYFRKDIFALFLSFFKLISGKENNPEQKKITYAVILGTIPAVILGIFLENAMDTVFRSSVLVAGTLILGAVIMFLADKFATQNKQITPRNGFVVGLFQALALIPGMSRSGMTISGGLFMGLNRELATRFSFILAFPILFGSGLKKFLDLGTSGLLDVIGPNLLIGCAVSFFSGLLAIHFLLKFLKNHNLNLFIWYRVIVAILILFLV